MCHDSFVFLQYHPTSYQLPTLPKFNITPEKLPPEKETSLPTTIFQGRAVKLLGGIPTIPMGNPGSVGFVISSGPWSLVKRPGTVTVDVSENRGGPLKNGWFIMEKPPIKIYIYTGWWFRRFFLCSPLICGRFPIWLYNIFQMGWNHQPAYVYLVQMWKQIYVLLVREINFKTLYISRCLPAL